MENAKYTPELTKRYLLVFMVSEIPLPSLRYQNVWCLNPAGLTLELPRFISQTFIQKEIHLLLRQVLKRGQTNHPANCPGLSSQR